MQDELQMLQDLIWYAKVVYTHYYPCNKKNTQSCLTNISTMLTQLLSREVTSKRFDIAAHTFWHYTTTSKYYLLSPIEIKTSQAWCTIRELHTFAYKIQSTMNLSNRDEISPLIKGYLSFVPEKDYLSRKFLNSTLIQSLWSQGSLEKNFIKQRRLKGIAKLKLKLPKQDIVCGFSTSNIFGSSSQLPIWGLIFMNFAVYVMWQIQEKHEMIRNWMVSVDSLLCGRYHTMLTYSISNNRLDHLIEDMLGLYFFGGEIARKYGGSYMLKVYLVGAIAGSVGHIAYCTILVPWLEGQPYDDFNYSMTPYILGASAATNAVVVIHVLLFPHHIILANYFLPVPGIVFGAYLILADLYDMYEEGTRTTHAGAIAGALTGIRLWWKIKRR